MKKVTDARQGGERGMTPAQGGEGGGCSQGTWRGLGEGGELRLGEAGGKGVVPALSQAYRDLTNVRHAYPCVIAPGASRSLKSLIDAVTAASGKEGDDAEVFKRHAWRLEAGIKQLVRERAGASLGELAQEAAARVVESSRAGEVKKAVLRGNVEAVQSALRVDAPVFDCGREALRRLLVAAAVHDWRRRGEWWLVETRELLTRLKDILLADDARSPEAVKPERLGASLGSGELDAAALAGIIGGERLGGPMPVARRRRIEAVSGTLERYLRVLEEPGEGGAEPLDVLCVYASLEEGQEAYRKRLSSVTGFVKAVHIARLEVENKYRENAHGSYFEAFDENSLSESERALCPPVLIVLEGPALDEGGVGVLFEALTCGAPLKVLAFIEELSLGGDWRGRLGVIAASLDHPYVLQAPISNFEMIARGFEAGLRYAGPAFAAIYAPGVSLVSPLPLYTLAAAGGESRVFPSLIYDPGAGPSRADRIDIRFNTQCDRVWPVETFAYPAENGAPVSLEVAFTLADFLLCDGRWVEHFRCAPVSEWHEQMRPLAEYLELEEERRRDLTPYILGVKEDGEVVRMLARQTVVDAARRCAGFWRNLQELGGVADSFAERRLEAERARLEKEKEEAIARVQKQYDEQLDRDVDGLTRVIVQRIASQLVSAEGGGPVARTWSLPVGAKPPAPGASGVAAPVVAAPVVEAPEEAEETFATDEPYIDTPLCTSCNECTKLNDRMFGYNQNKQAYIKDASAGAFRELVAAAEKCPVRIIHPGKPKNPNEPGLEELVKRAAPFN